MKRIFSIFFLLLFVSCQQTEKGMMYVEGEVEGLKKGKIILQHYDDAWKEKKIDSVIANGNGKFSFKFPVESPEVFSLILEKEEKNPYGNKIIFFGEPTKISIQTQNETFDITARISGSETQKKLEEYNAVLRKFGKQNTNFLYEQLQAVKDKNMQKADSLSKLSAKNTQRQVLYSINYAFNNKNSCIAPYIALTEIDRITPKFLDSIYKSLPKEIADSKYGKFLRKEIDNL